MSSNRSSLRHGSGMDAAVACPSFEALEPRLLLTVTSPFDASAADISPIWFQTLVDEEAMGQGTQDKWVVQLSRETLTTVRDVAAASSVFTDAPFDMQVIRGLGMAGQIVIETYGALADDVAAWLTANPSIACFTPDIAISIPETIPTDPKFGVQWGLRNTGQTVGGTPGTIDADIDATDAWDITRGDASVIVAVIDSGVNYNHPDLAANIWTNSAEVAGDGLDNDGNGFVDDVHGYDFWSAPGDPADGDPMDENGHGTHVAGTIAAVDNNGKGGTGSDRFYTGTVAPQIIGFEQILSWVIPL